MRHDRVTDQVREQAALYALGALEPDERGSFERHLEEGCPVCKLEMQEFHEATAQLALSAPTVQPDAQLRQRLMATIQPEPGRTQVWKDWRQETPTGLCVVRATQGDWEATGAPGVTVKQLSVDQERDRATMLVRMAPGSLYPAHRHAGKEECLVLEGDLRVGDLVLRAGDYQCAWASSVHGVSSTVEGCLLFIVSSQHDELMA